MGERHEAVVVGGGLAGLTAAREFSRMGRSVVLLEGRDRLGGRTWTREFAGKEVEYGGSFVHWWQPHVFAELSRFGIPYKPGPAPAHWSWWGNGELHRASESDVEERMSGLIDQVFHDAAEAFPLPINTLAGGDAFAARDAISIRARLDELDLSAEDDDLVSGLLSTCVSARNEEASFGALMQWYALSGYTFRGLLDAAAVFTAQTTGALVDAIADEIGGEIRLGTPVESITQDDSGVTVASREGETFAAEVVVAALPLNVLDAVEFSPGLPPDVKRMAGERAASHGSKLWVHARGIDEAFFITAPDSEPFNFINTVYEAEDGGQIILVFGSDASAVDPADFDAVSAAFRRLVPGDYEIVEVGAHDWTVDEFALGTWSFDRPGQRSTALEAAQQRHGRLKIAGADFASGWNGFMDGAIESGQRAARELSPLIKKQLVS